MKTRYLLWSGWYMLILDIMLNADHVHPVETICHLPNCMVPATLPVTTPLATPWCLDEALDVLPRPLSISLQAPKGTLQSGQVPGDKRVDLVDLVELWCRWVTYIYIYTGWWFRTIFIFHNIWDNPSHWLSYFSEGLQPPTRDDFELGTCGLTRAAPWTHGTHESCAVVWLALAIVCWLRILQRKMMLVLLVWIIFLTKSILCSGGFRCLFILLIVWYCIGSNYCMTCWWHYAFLSQTCWTYAIS